MTTTEALFFTGMVFLTILLLALAIIVPTAGSAAQAGRTMRKRIGQHLDMQEPGVTSLLRDQYLKDLTPFERSLENLPGVQSLSIAIEQSGIDTRAYKMVLLGLFMAAGVAIAIWFFFQNLLIALAVGLPFIFVPALYILVKRKQRMDRFEEQLPEALEIMSRALQAGHPFNETLNFVGEEMDDPIAAEFGRVFSDLNFGLPMKAAFQGILTRVPSVSLHTLVTAVLIQSESGGRLAEILDKVAEVIRGRFRLQRKLKTLSAEGRMSAWVLGLVPFVLAGMMLIVAPDYLPVLLEDPLGIKIILTSFALMIVGIFWIRKIIRIRV